LTVHLLNIVNQKSAQEMPLWGIYNYSSFPSCVNLDHSKGYGDIKEKLDKAAFINIKKF
jgi:hypothetical protein